MTINFDDDLHFKLKVLRAQKGVPITDLIPRLPSKLVKNSKKDQRNNTASQPLIFSPATEVQMDKNDLSALSAVSPGKGGIMLSADARETLELAQKGIERVSEMARGINGLCANIDPGREEVYEFSCAIATIIAMLREDADLAAKNLMEVLDDYPH